MVGGGEEVRRQGGVSLPGYPTIPLSPSAQADDPLDTEQSVLHGVHHTSIWCLLDARLRGHDQACGFEHRKLTE